IIKLRDAVDGLHQLKIPSLVPIHDDDFGINFDLLVSMAKSSENQSSGGSKYGSQASSALEVIEFVKPYVYDGLVYSLILYSLYKAPRIVLDWYRSQRAESEKPNEISHEYKTLLDRIMAGNLDETTIDNLETLQNVWSLALSEKKRLERMVRSAEIEQGLSADEFEGRVRLIYHVIRQLDFTRVRLESVLVELTIENIRKDLDREKRKVSSSVEGLNGGSTPDKLTRIFQKKAEEYTGYDWIVINQAAADLLRDMIADDRFSEILTLNIQGAIEEKTIFELGSDQLLKLAAVIKTHASVAMATVWQEMFSSAYRVLDAEAHALRGRLDRHNAYLRSGKMLQAIMVLDPNSDYWLGHLATNYLHQDERQLAQATINQMERLKRNDYVTLAYIKLEMARELYQGFTGQLKAGNYAQAYNDMQEALRLARQGDRILKETVRIYKDSPAPNAKQMPRTFSGLAVIHLIFKDIYLQAHLDSGFVKNAKYDLMALRHSLQALKHSQEALKIDGTNEHSLKIFVATLKDLPQVLQLFLNDLMTIRDVQEIREIINDLSKAMETVNLFVSPSSRESAVQIQQLVVDISIALNSYQKVFSLFVQGVKQMEGEINDIRQFQGQLIRFVLHSTETAQVKFVKKALADLFDETSFDLQDIFTLQAFVLAAFEPLTLNELASYVVSEFVRVSGQDQLQSSEKIKEEMVRRFENKKYQMFDVKLTAEAPSVADNIENENGNSVDEKAVAIDRTAYNKADVAGYIEADEKRLANLQSIFGKAKPWINPIRIEKISQDLANIGEEMNKFKVQGSGLVQGAGKTLTAKEATPQLQELKKIRTGIDG
ncbi:MAG: hypothetical protein JNN05_06845, partial [Candidatus Omnitrophica bacterium]|nr:hypothetical protein [Candidatus Omnitrophota bacterium]